MIPAATPRTGARHVLRAGGLLVLLLSVVVMHQLGGGGHWQSMGAPMSMRAATAAAPSTQDGRAEQDVAGPPAALRGGRVEAAAAGVLHAPGRPERQLRAAGMGTMPACLAVLPSLLVLLAALGRRRRVPVLRRPSGAAVARGPAGPGPPALTLEELCVMRS